MLNAMSCGVVFQKSNLKQCTAELSDVTRNVNKHLQWVWLNRQWRSKGADRPGRQSRGGRKNGGGEI